MSFYIRKSLRAGPFRFNISKSGIGVSTGIPGFRIGTGPRGNYVHMGRNGFYYRRTIPSGVPKKQVKSPQTRDTFSDVSSVQMEEIESGDILEMQDSSSATLLAEINNKHKKSRTWPIVTVICVVGLLAFFILPMLMVRIPQLESFALPFTCLFFPLLLLFSGTIIFLAYQQDQLSKTVVLFYELDKAAEQAYQALYNAFKEVTDCSRVWHIEAKGDIHDLQERKRQAGASTLIRRNSIQLTCKTPSYVSTNLSVPTIPVGRQSLYFFPDRILVYDRDKVGAISYAKIQLQVGNTQFIEEDGVPRDSKVVDYTWKYVNKKGGPDKRFKDNRQLPIALYGVPSVLR